MENAVVYARYSSHSQTEQSIEGQLNAAYKYANDKGYKIIKEYCDRAKTGTNDNREEFQKMLSDTKKKKFTVIIVWKVDRFGRNREEITFNKYKCKKNGVRVEYVAENISQGPEGVILESVLEGMAEYYSLQLSQNVKRGYLESAKKRHVIGMTPLGYTRSKDKTYMVIPEEAKTVRLIFDKYNAGMSQRELVDYLNKRSYTNKGRTFTKSSLQRILNDERYIGTFTYKDIIREENAIPAILTREVFYADRTPKSMWKYDEYKLSRYLVCGNCKSPMKGSSGYSKTGKKYNYYICGKCKKIHVRADKLEMLVKGKVREMMNKELIDNLAHNLYEYHKQNAPDRTEEEDLKRNLDAISTKINNLLLSIEKGISIELVAPRIKELEIKRDELSTELNKMQLERPFTITLDAIKFFLTKITPDKFLSKVIVFNDHVKIALNCVDIATEIDSSTMSHIMALSNHESNFSYMVYKYWAIVNLPL